MALVAVLVIIVDGAVVGGAEAIEALGDPVEGQRGEQDFRVGGVAVAGVGQGLEDLHRIAGRDARLEIDVIGENADELVDERFRDLLLEGGLVDGVVDLRQAAGGRRLRRGFGEIGRGRGRRVGPDEDVVVGAGDGRLVGAAVVDADPDEIDIIAAVGERQADGLAGVEVRDVDELRQGADDLVGVGRDDVVGGEQRAQVLVARDGHDLLEKIAASGRVGVALGDAGDVFGNDTNAESRERAVVGADVAGAGIGERQRGGLDAFVGGKVGGGANDLFHLGGCHLGGGIEVGRVDREGADLDRDLAVDVGAVKLVVTGGGHHGAGSRGRRLGSGGVGEDAHGVERRHFGGELVVGGAEGRLDPGKRLELDEVALALAGDGRDLHDLAGGDLLLQRSHAVALATEDEGLVLAGGGGGGFGEGGELVGAVEGRHQGGAHQADRGDAGEDGAGEPAPAHRAANGRVGGRPVVADRQRRLVAEINYPGIGAVHHDAQPRRPPHKRLCLPNRRRAVVRPRTPRI